MNIKKRKPQTEIEKRIAAALHNGAELLVMGEIALRTGLIVSQAPRYNAGFDVIVNSHDLKKGCRVEVKHSRSDFKANISGDEYDILVLVYHQSKTIENEIVYSDREREIYVFPRPVIEVTDKGKTGINFNPHYVENHEKYLNAFHHISEFLN